MKTKSTPNYPLRREFLEFIDNIKFDFVKDKNFPCRFFLLPGPNKNVKHFSTFRLFFSGKFTHNENTLTGFPINREKCVYRCFPVIFDKAWLGLSFPLRNQSRLLDKVDSLLDNREDFILDIHYKSPEYQVDIYTKDDELYKDLFDDELGDFADISDVKELCLVSIPDNLVRSKYKLVGERFYAPNTSFRSENSKDIVLYAELNNNFDKSAIKVLRWVPGNFVFGGNEEVFYNDMLCNLGYISREQNGSLHEFMVKNNSRILFAKMVEKEITIVGGLEIFYTNDYSFPTFLKNIQIL